MGAHVDAARSAWFMTQLRVANQEHKVLEKVKRRFRRRGWPVEHPRPGLAPLPDERVVAASMALCFLILRAPEAPIRISPGSDDPPCWKAIAGLSTASQVVEALELEDLLRPDVLRFAQPGNGTFKP